MPQQRVSFLVYLLVGCASFACGSPSASSTDAGSTRDAGIVADAGAADSGTITDAGTTMDMDAGSADAGSDMDAGAPDAGPGPMGTLVLPGEYLSSIRTTSDGSGIAAADVQTSGSLGQLHAVTSAFSARVVASKVPHGVYAFSPDNQHLAVPSNFSDENGTGLLSVIDVAANAPTATYGTLDFRTAYLWGADSKHILFMPDAMGQTGGFADIQLGAIGGGQNLTVATDTLFALPKSDDNHYVLVTDMAGAPTQGALRLVDTVADTVVDVAPSAYAAAIDHLGKRIVWTDASPGKLWSQAIGGTAVKLSDTAGVIAVSNGGAEVAFTSGGDLYAVDGEGQSAPLKVGTGASNLPPEFTSDGKWLLYFQNYQQTNGLGDLWATRTDGSVQPVQVAAQVFPYSEITSRDGRWLAFIASPLDATTQLPSPLGVGDAVLFDAQSGAVTQIASGVQQGDVAFSPDGSRLLYRLHNGELDTFTTADHVTTEVGSSIRQYSYGFVGAGAGHVVAIADPTGTLELLPDAQVLADGVVEFTVPPGAPTTLIYSVWSGAQAGVWRASLGQ